MRYLLLFAFIIGIFSCSGKRDVPANIIKPVKMQAIMKDLFLIDAVNTERLSRAYQFQFAEENKSGYERVFQLHKVTRKEFEDSYNYYVSHPDFLEEIVDSVSSQLTRESLKTDIKKDSSGKSK